MQQPIEDRGGQDLVSGQHLGPVLDALVRRDQDAAALVALADEPEEEARLLTTHRFEADLVDDQQRGRDVLLAPQACR